MSHRKMHHWTCDTCGVEVAREGYGLPQGWTWTHHDYAEDWSIRIL